MLSLLTSLFTPPPPRCHNTGSLLLASRRAATDAKYTARPLDFFPNHLVPRHMLEETRREAGVLDEMFGRYKREAKCGGTMGRLRNCEMCGDWCCNVSLFFFFSLLPCRLGLGRVWLWDREKDSGRAVVFWGGHDGLGHLGV